MVLDHRSIPSPPRGSVNRYDDVACRSLGPARPTVRNGAVRHGDAVRRRPASSTWTRSAAARDLAGRRGQRRSGRERHHRRVADHDRRREGSRSSGRRSRPSATGCTVVAGVGTYDTAHSVQLAKQAADGRRARRPRGHALLLAAATGRVDRPLQRGRRRHRAAGDAVRHPAALRGRHRAGHPAPARRTPTDHRGEGRQGRPLRRFEGDRQQRPGLLLRRRRAHPAVARGRRRRHHLDHQPRRRPAAAGDGGRRAGRRLHHRQADPRGAAARPPGDEPHRRRRRARLREMRAAPAGIRRRRPPTATGPRHARAGRARSPTIWPPIPDLAELAVPATKVTSGAA